MGSESYWQAFCRNARELWQDLVWAVMPGTVIRVPTKEGAIAVGHEDRRWYDVGASFVEVYSDDPHDHYGPWLIENVGREFIDWQVRRCLTAKWDVIDSDIQLDDYVLVKIRNPQWATIAGLALR